MTLCYQFSQFKAAKVQTFNMVLKVSALRQLINEIRPLSCQKATQKSFLGLEVYINHLLFDYLALEIL